MKPEQRALELIGIMTLFDGMDGHIKGMDSDIYVISHAFSCCENCIKKARQLMANHIRCFRKIRYAYYYNGKSL